MDGNNKMYFNQVSMREIVSHYLETVMFSDKMKNTQEVNNVVYDTQKESFTVMLKALPKEDKGENDGK